MALAMHLDGVLDSWDGRSSDDIRAIFDRFRGQPGFAEAVVRACLEPGRAVGATWLLKAWLESGGTLSREQIGLLLAALDRFQSWQATLHVLQSLEHLPVGPDDHARVNAILKGFLAHTNKFLRAWAYNGLHVLSLQYPQYLDETRKILEMAQRDEAPSVKARIRNLRKGPPS